MNNTALKDKRDRDKITDILDKNLLVEAGAGSGKTTSLVKRLVALIKKGKNTADEIAAITFTRKAAAELKERFHLKLEEEINKSENKKEKQNMKKALENIDQCFTGTIHSFCARILRERPVEAAIDPDFDEIDNIEEKALLEESWEEYLDLAVNDNSEILKKLYKLGISPLDLKNNFKKLALYPEIDVKVEKINKPDLNNVLQKVLEFAKEAKKYIPDNEPEKGYDTLQKTVIYVLRMKNYLNINEDKNIIKLLKRFDKKQKVTLNRWINRDVAREYRDQKTKFLKENYILPILDHWKEYSHYYIYEFLKPALDYYKHKRKKKGVVNFQDLLLLTAKLLKENSEVRNYFHNQYKTLLVDEFQDTDPIQAEIIFYLTASNFEEKRWDKCNPEDGSLFVVGDPKQSIYRFRRADIDIYQKVKKLILKSGGEVIKLTSNFRSLNSIGDYLNPVFENIFPDKSNNYQAQFAPLNTVHKNKYDNGVKYYNITSDYSTKDQIVKKDADNIARIIRSAIDGGMKFYRSEKNESPEAKASDFMILLRYKDSMDIYAKTLEEYNIATIMTGNSTLDSSEEIKALFKLFKYLNDIDNEMLLVAVLKGLFFGFSDSDLYYFERGGGRFNIYKSFPGSLNDKLKNKFEKAYNTLKKYHKWSNNYSAVVVLEKVIDDLGLIPSVLRKEMKDSKLGNIYYLIEKMKDLESKKQFSFMEMVEQFEIIMNNPPEEELNIKESKDGVRIMNLHKAKGLQAEVVFLAHPYKKVDKDADYYINREGNNSNGYFTFTKKDGYHTKTIAKPINWETYLEEENKYQKAEENRLLYVAATRAKNMLIVSSCEKSKKKNPWQKLLANMNKEQQIEIPDIVNEKKEKSSKISEVEFKEKRKEFENWEENLRNKSYVNISSEDIKDKAKIFAVNRQGEGSQEWGNLIHLLLEKLVKEGSLDEEFIKRKLENYKFDKNKLSEVNKLIRNFKSSNLWKRINKSEKVLCEVPFKLKIEKEDKLYKFLEVNMSENDELNEKIILNGIIDLVFKEGSSWVIVDYKTDKVEEKDDLRRLEKAYEPQVKLYSNVWENITAEKVGEAKVKFVSESFI